MYCVSVLNVLVSVFHVFNVLCPVPVLSCVDWYFLD